MVGAADQELHLDRADVAGVVAVVAVVAEEEVVNVGWAGPSPLQRIVMCQRSRYVHPISNNWAARLSKRKDSNSRTLTGRSVFLVETGGSVCI